MIILFVDNLFIFYLGGQSVSCKASLAALRLMAIFVIFVVLLSENKYDDDDLQARTDTPALHVKKCPVSLLRVTVVQQSKN